MASKDADITLDVLGFHCPVPVHEAKRVLKTMKNGEVLIVMADDPETKADIPALLNRTGDSLLSVEDVAGEYHYRIQKGIVGMTSIIEVSEIPADARLPTGHGEFRIRVFQDNKSGLDHVALTLGDMNGPDPVIVRMHSDCPF